MSVRQLLRQYGLRPRKGLGQHFLEDETALGRIVAAADLGSDDAVLEIGPGLGTLTRRLAERAGRVVAVELDRQLVAVLADTLAGQPNVEVIHGDILELASASLFSGPYKVVANLPYYITSAVLRHLLEAEARPELMVLTVQREVAQRLTATPDDMSLLAVSVQFYGQPRLVARIPAGAFYPAPKVDSAVVRIDVYARRPVAVDDVEAFFAVVRAGFAGRRKMLRNALSRGLSRPVAEVEAALQRAGVDAKRRAETLSVAEWGVVYGALAAVKRET